MQDTDKRLLALAQRVAAVYTASEAARASAVLGSVARRQSDRFSDIDLAIYYETMPPDEEITAGRAALDGTNWLRIFAVEDALADSFTVDGVECQVIHCTVAQIDADLRAVLDDYATEHEKHAVVGGILDALPLFGTEIIAGWQARAAAYPDALAQAVVRNHLRFWPSLVLKERVVPRDAPLFFHKALLDDAKNLLAVLSGLNRLYPQLNSNAWTLTSHGCRSRPRTCRRGSSRHSAPNRSRRSRFSTPSSRKSSTSLSATCRRLRQPRPDDDFFRCRGG